MIHVPQDHFATALIGDTPPRDRLRLDDHAIANCREVSE